MKRIFVIALGILLFFLILIGVTFLESIKQKTPTPITTPTVTKTPSSSQRTEQLRAGSNKLLKILKERPTPILSADSVAKTKIINELGRSSGTISTTSTYRLEYVKAPNDFEVEILTLDTASAKNDAIEYLKSKGFSEDGICKLPLVFYVNYEVSKSKEYKDKQFNPIPDFCL